MSANRSGLFAAALCAALLLTRQVHADTIACPPSVQVGESLTQAVPADWQAALDTLTKYTDLKTDMKAEDFYTNEFVPEKL